MRRLKTSRAICRQAISGRSVGRRSDFAHDALLAHDYKEALEEAEARIAEANGEGNLLALLDLYHERAEKAEAEIARLREGMEVLLEKEHRWRVSSTGQPLKRFEGSISTKDIRQLLDAKDGE